MAIDCPECDSEIESEINKKWTGNYWIYCDDFECPQCRAILEIDVEMIPWFTVSRRINHVG
uniref:Uncharacterized protein n=1 Tax=viral metagenome TaxID=1070528 RepID=A0A6M3KFI2_9ZZZZ